MLEQWVAKWGIDPRAVAELLDLINPPETKAGGSEAGVQSRVRLECSRKGWVLWRNNVGAYIADNGSLVRYGLANDSPEMNRRIKSSDLIGIRPVIITVDMVGSTLGQFVALECKRPGWAFSNKGREEAQSRFLAVVNGAGGFARFVTGEGQV